MPARIAGITSITKLSDTDPITLEPFNSQAQVVIHQSQDAGTQDSPIPTQDTATQGQHSAHSSSGEGLADPSGEKTAKKAKKARKARESYSLPEEEDDEALEFVREHPQIWYRGNKDYKFRLWYLQTLGDKMNKPLEFITKWWKNLKDWYIKIIRKKSGSGLEDVKLTDRERSLLVKLHFYRSYVTPRSRLSTFKDLRLFLLLQQLFQLHHPQMQKMTIRHLHSQLRGSGACGLGGHGVTYM